MQFSQVLSILLGLVLSMTTSSAQRYAGYPRNNYAALSGRSFGEGMLRPGYDQSAGYFNEYDVPSFGAPNQDATPYYG